MSKNISDGAAARAMLQDVARQRGKSLAELSRLIGRNPAYLQQYVMRGSPRQLNAADVRTIADYLGVAASALGPLAPAGTSAAPRGYWREVPRIALEASAGPGAVGLEEIAYDTIRFSHRWLREMGLEGAALSAIRVEGESMEPVLRSGDEIVVDRNKRTGEGIFVVRIGDALHVKTVLAAVPGRITLISENHAYPPLELARDEVEIIGRVVWKGGRV
ncbi:LexA family transcriptional regulator [Qipengyuania sediminis]|uniref:LexA family transcriptional regulator n=1 Tax=Qipengyuania sediminis TaxID=1532023 RepID=UPI001059AD61|nr:LexA family transcriptional regulator [Qipengyuania sediminis]